MTNDARDRGSSAPGRSRGSRVQSLYFLISSTNETTYEVDDESHYTNLYGDFELGPHGLTWRPAMDFESTESAMAYVAPYLKAWEIQSDLDFGVGALRFQFKVAEVRHEPEVAGSKAVTLELESAITLADTCTPHVTRHRYPRPPEPRAFSTSQFVELAHVRWQAYCRGREPLPSAAYFVFTVLITLAGSARGAAAQFEIDKAVLDKWSALSTLAGGEDALRKFSGAIPTRMLDTERVWLEAVVKRAIRRLAEVAGGTPLKRITMADLPSPP